MNLGQDCLKIMDQADTADWGQEYLKMDWGWDCHMDQAGTVDWGHHMDQADTEDFGQDCHMDQVDYMDCGQASLVIIKEVLVSNFPMHLGSSLDTIAVVGTPRTIATGMGHILHPSHSVQACPINRVLMHLVVN